MFLLITRLYKSFKSLVANLPPSSGTSGRNSGGITGITSSTIHSGRLFDFLNASTTLNLLASFKRFCILLVSLNSLLSSIKSKSRSTFFSKSFTASAPILATKPFAPKSSTDFLYCSSVKICLSFKPDDFGSVTMYDSKYTTLSISLIDKSRIESMRDGVPLKNHIWHTGDAKSI